MDCRKWHSCFFALLAMASGVNAQQWAEFRPAEINYSIEMPGEWTITSEPGDQSR